MKKKSLEKICFGLIPGYMLLSQGSSQPVTASNLLVHASSGLLLGLIVYGVVWGYSVIQAKTRGGPVFEPETPSPPPPKEEGPQAPQTQTGSEKVIESITIPVRAAPKQRGLFAPVIYRMPLWSWMGMWIFAAIAALVLLNWDQEQIAFGMFQEHGFSGFHMFLAFAITWLRNGLFWSVVLVAGILSAAAWKKARS
jgi:hypothetical protein